MKPDPTVMNRVTYYSILVRDIKLTLLQLRKTILLIRGLRVTIPSTDNLRDIEMELIGRQLEIQNACRLLLEPLFEGIDFGHKYLNYWALPMEDVKNGYSQLEEIKQYKKGKPLIFGRKFILILRDYEDKTLGKFYAGELVPLEKAIHFINDIPAEKQKPRGLYDAMINTVQMAMRYRTSKLLSDE